MGKGRGKGTAAGSWQRHPPPICKGLATPPAGSEAAPTMNGLVGSGRRPRALGHSPKYGSLGHPFNCTPFGVHSIKKCRTSSLAKSPAGARDSKGREVLQTERLGRWGHGKESSAPREAAELGGVMAWMGGQNASSDHAWSWGVPGGPFATSCRTVPRDPDKQLRASDVDSSSFPS